LIRKNIGKITLIIGIILMLTSCKANSESMKEIHNADKLTSASSSLAKEDIQSSSVASSSISAEPIQNDLTIEGFWQATGKEDGVGSTWNFDNNLLTVNDQYSFQYRVVINVDKNEYTVVTITNSKGTNHALLLKRANYGMDGVTVEGQAYQEYLVSETVPAQNQVIKFVQAKPSINKWSGMDEYDVLLVKTKTFSFLVNQIFPIRMY